MQTTYCWKSWTLLTSPCHSRPCDHMDWSSLWQKQQQRWEWVWPEYKTKHDHEKGSWIVANPIFLWNTFSLIRFHLCKTWRQLWSPPHFLEPQSQSANLLPNQLSLGEKKNLNTLLYLKEKSHTINLDQNLQNLRSKFINGFLKVRQLFKNLPNSIQYPFWTFIRLNYVSGKGLSRHSIPFRIITLSALLRNYDNLKQIDLFKLQTPLIISPIIPFQVPFSVSAPNKPSGARYMSYVNLRALDSSFNRSIEYPSYDLAPPSSFFTMTNGGSLCVGKNMFEYQPEWTLSQ